MPEVGGAEREDERKDGGDRGQRARMTLDGGAFDGASLLERAALSLEASREDAR